MRKSILLTLIFPVLVFAQGRVAGPSPQSMNVTLTFIIPTAVGIYVNNNAEWNFNNITFNPSNPIYPPTTYPEQYYPTTPAASPYQQLEYMVAGSPTGSPVNWVLTVSGDGDPGSGILLSDIAHSPAGMGSWFPGFRPSRTRSTSGRIGAWSRRWSWVGPPSSRTGWCRGSTGP